MSPDTSPPQTLGNYDIVSKIAEGGMGTVYKGRNRTTGELVAVKVIAPTTAKNPVLLQRFEREFLAARVLDHPNVVRALDYCGTGPHPFLVMEFVDGESIGQRVERKGALPEAESVRLIAQVCEGLQRAHKQGLVHRDVKPDNILVTREGVAKLTDLGLVKDVDGDMNLTKTGRGLGTPHFMAPEQFRNAKNVDVRGDIYSLGATLYAMVTGVIPFENASPLDCWMKKVRNEFPSPRELNPAVSERVDWAIRRAMSAEPDRRPASCREFLEDLTGQSRTGPKTGAIQPAAPVPNSANDVWYLVYKDETGATHTVKGSTDSIRNAIRDNLLGDTTLILVNRTKTGQFQPLAGVPEFRDMVVAPAALPTPGGQRGSGSTSNAGRRASDAADVDVGSTPGVAGGSMRGSRSGLPSGRHTPPTGSSPRTSTPIGSPNTQRRPPSGPRNEEETAPYEPEAPPPRSPRRDSRRDMGRREAEPAPKSPVNWTPILLVLVLVLSVAVGYLLLFK